MIFRLICSICVCVGVNACVCMCMCVCMCVCTWMWISDRMAPLRMLSVDLVFNLLGGTELDRYRVGSSPCPPVRPRRLAARTARLHDGPLTRSSHSDSSGLITHSRLARQRNLGATQSDAEMMVVAAAAVAVVAIVVAAAAGCDFATTMSNVSIASQTVQHEILTRTDFRACRGALGNASDLAPNLRLSVSSSTYLIMKSVYTRHISDLCWFPHRQRDVFADLAYELCACRCS